MNSLETTVISCFKIPDTSRSICSLIVAAVFGFAVSFITGWFRRNLYITTSVLFFKVVQNVNVSWIFLGGLCVSLNNEVGGYPVGGGGV